MAGIYKKKNEEKKTLYNPPVILEDGRMEFVSFQFFLWPNKKNLSGFFFFITGDNAFRTFALIST